MFIKWLKELTHDWWDIWGGPIKGILGFWMFISWLFVLVDSGASKGDLNEFAKVFHYKVVPVMIITGITPSLAVLAWYIGKYIYSLYIDYQYFVANGGKRKNTDSTEYDPYRKDVQP